MVIWAYGPICMYGKYGMYPIGVLIIWAYGIWDMVIWAYGIWDMVIWSYEQTKGYSNTPIRRGRRIRLENNVGHGIGLIPICK